MALCSLAAQAAITNFTAGFESTEGYVAGGALDGQSGWTGYAISTNQTSTNPGTAGNGVIVGGLGGSGQAAYVGLTPLPAPYNKLLELSRPLGLDPNGVGLPMVNFSARIKVADTVSPLGPWDSFYIEFYNQSDVRLFGLKFDNYNRWIAYELPSGSTNILYPFINLTNSVEYTVNLAMNFASNRCSLAFNGVLVTNNLQLTKTGNVLNLGTLAVTWFPQQIGFHADNYMLFDDLRVVSAELVPPRPQLTLLNPGGNGAAATLRLNGLDGFRFAVEGSTNLTSWQAVRTNIITSGVANYTDSGATNRPARFYRARWVP
jgi:hypothetical protein